MDSELLIDGYDYDYYEHYYDCDYKDYVVARKTLQ